MGLNQVSPILGFAFPAVLCGKVCCPDEKPSCLTKDLVFYRTSGYLLVQLFWRNKSVMDNSLILKKKKSRSAWF
jgi:hypothetical protein